MKQLGGRSLRRPCDVGKWRPCQPQQSVHVQSVAHQLGGHTQQALQAAVAARHARRRGDIIQILGCAMGQIVISRALPELPAHVYQRDGLNQHGLHPAMDAILVG